MTRTIQEYVEDLNYEIMEQWSEMISNINRKLAENYSKIELGSVDEIFEELEDIYRSSIIFRSDIIVIDIEDSSGDEYVTHIIEVRRFAEDGDLAYEEQIQSDRGTALFNYQHVVKNNREKISQTNTLIEEHSDGNPSFITRIYSKSNKLLVKIVLRDAIMTDFE